MIYLFTDSKGVRSNKNKKKNRRRKDHLKDSSSNSVNGNHNKVGTPVCMSFGGDFFSGREGGGVDNQCIYGFCISALFFFSFLYVLNFELWCSLCLILI